MSVLVGPDSQGDALVHGVVGQPVQLEHAGLQDGDARRRGELHRLGDPLVRLDPERRPLPSLARRWEASLSELSDARLEQLFRTSQPAWTSPETRYRRVS